MADTRPIDAVPAAPSLADLTTMRVGGAARALVQADTAQELLDAVRAAVDSGEDWLLVGGGSNTIVSDDGFDGTVIRVANRGIEPLGPGARPGTIRVRVQAGETWDDLVAHAVHHGWTGIEALSGIPGSVGAAPVQNIGAYGQELSETLVGIEFLDEGSAEPIEVAAAELGLGYRTSALKRGRTGVVTAVTLELGNEPDATGAALGAPIAYRQLAEALGVQVGDRVGVAELRRAVLALRAEKGMLLDPGDPDSVSAGSFFTNPIVTERFARTMPADAPRWPQDPDEPDVVVPLDSVNAETSSAVGVAAEAAATRARIRSDAPRLVKLSAAWLIERSGIRRGYSLPGSHAAVSSKHTLAITNRGGATAAEIAQLAGYIQARVQSEFGVVLQPEPVLVGLTL